MQKLQLQDLGGGV